jgi:fructose-1,6-bisphosphatase I
MTSSIVTIERHILEQERHFPAATGIFTNLMYDIALAAKLIARETTRAGLADILGDAGEKNVQGEEQQKLDVYAHNTLVRLNDHTGRVCVMGSEEEPNPIPISDKYECGPYVLLFDPLDGSSNIDYNVSIGTIFSIHRRITPEEAGGKLEDLLQPGFRQVAAGYVVYGSSTMLVYSAGQGVHGFTLDPSLGEFLLSHPNIRIPETPRYYSINEGYQQYWYEGTRRYVRWITGQDPEDPSEGLSLRYIGSMIADFHRTLLTGGIFMYPADTHYADKPFGKLRLNYECAPMAFIAKHAGGYASDGVNPILNIQPTSLHQRTPILAGNRSLVERAEQYIAQYDGEWIQRYKQNIKLAKPVPG